MTNEKPPFITIIQSQVRFPPDGHVVSVRMRDQGREVLGEAGAGDLHIKAPVLGLYQSRASQSGGRLVSITTNQIVYICILHQSEASYFILVVSQVVFGDSNCIDGAHLTKPCYWLVDAMLEYTSAGHLPQVRNIIIGVMWSVCYNHVSSDYSG